MDKLDAYIGDSRPQIIEDTPSGTLESLMKKERKNRVIEWLKLGAEILVPIGILGYGIEAIANAVDVNSRQWLYVIGWPTIWLLTVANMKVGLASKSLDNIVHSSCEIGYYKTVLESRKEL